MHGIAKGRYVEFTTLGARKTAGQHDRPTSVGTNGIAQKVASPSAFRATGACQEASEFPHSWSTALLQISLH